jgi:uncharacterized protein (DUF2236 family)
LRRLPSIRSAIAEEVRGLFREEGQGASVYDGPGLFAEGAVIRDVHGDVMTMMIGGIAALFLQMLHPLALAGVWDHSNFRQDMQGRLRRTARFIATTTYGDLAQAEAAIHKVRQIHGYVTGTLPDGTPYRADDPRLLGWVHITEAVSFLDAYIRYREPMMSRARQDAYFDQIADINTRLGAVDLPRSRRAAMAYMRDYRTAAWGPCNRSACRRVSILCRAGRGACTDCPSRRWPNHCCAQARWGQRIPCDGRLPCLDAPAVRSGLRGSMAGNRATQASN